VTNILGLADRVARLEGLAATRAHRILEVSLIRGETHVPAELEPWVADTFGSTEAVRLQRVVRVTNLATLNATLFAPLRSRRPVDGRRSGDLDAEIARTRGDPFCHPETGTPAEPGGRLRGRRVTTGANAAMADAHHAVLVFDPHDPLAFDADLVADLLETGRAWAEWTRKADPEASAYLLVWNCLWRAGGSIVHGHAQALLGRGRPYAAAERFARDAHAYRAAHGSDFSTDLLAVHRDLGLADDQGPATIVAHVTPRKEREVLVAGASGTDERDPAFAAAVARALIGLRDRAGVRSFNFALWRAPLGGGDARWEGIGPMAWIVDRGDPFVRPSDIGAMELYGTPIVGSDPYDVIAAMR
jgi:hypothetical protein